MLKLFSDRFVLSFCKCFRIFVEYFGLDIIRDFVSFSFRVLSFSEFWDSIVFILLIRFCLSSCLEDRLIEVNSGCGMGNFCC